MKLVKGRGSLETGACWMSAVTYYVGGEWSDHPECVDPAIRTLCIGLNDGCESNEERERLIGPHIFAPVGTATSDESIQARRLSAIRAAVFDWAREALDSARVQHELRPFGEYTNAAYAANAAHAAQAAAYAANAAHAAQAAAHAAAYAAANAVAAANAAHTRHRLLTLILELCAIGDRAEVQCVRTQEETLRFLEEVGR